MKKIELSELKRIQIEILDSIVHFCEENNLRYYLAYGTLLGAVRHQGYIPWDDDIDIHMPRPDYEWFIANYKNNIYSIIDNSLDAAYTLPFAKVHDTRTLFHETLYLKNTYGIFIDIFPLDSIKDVQQAKVAVKWRRLLNAKRAILGKGRGFFKNVAMLATKIFLLPFSMKDIILKIHKISKRYDYGDTMYICSMYSQLAYKEIFPKEIFDGFVMLPFEGKMYRAPKGYEEYLRTNYNDYMQLPPKEKQKSTHTAIVYWR